MKNPNLIKLQISIWHLFCSCKCHLSNYSSVVVRHTPRTPSDCVHTFYEKKTGYKKRILKSSTRSSPQPYAAVGTKSRNRYVNPGAVLEAAWLRRAAVARGFRRTGYCAVSKRGTKMSDNFRNTFPYTWPNHSLEAVDSVTESKQISKPKSAWEH